MRGSIVPARIAKSKAIQLRSAEGGGDRLNGVTVLQDCRKANFRGLILYVFQCPSAVLHGGKADSRSLLLDIFKGRTVILY